VPAPPVGSSRSVAISCPAPNFRGLRQRCRRNSAALPCAVPGNLFDLKESKSDVDRHSSLLMMFRFFYRFTQFKQSGLKLLWKKNINRPWHISRNKALFAWLDNGDNHAFTIPIKTIKENIRQVRIFPMQYRSNLLFEY
jgi:hypothetical protein